jgi:amino acid transporter
MSLSLSRVSGFIIFPFIWAIPEALVTAELGAAFQDPSAGLAWVEHAFGERMGGLNGYFGWLSGALGTHCFIMFSCLPVWKGTSSCALTHDDFAIHTHTTADNAIYPTLFIEYVSSVAGWGKDEFGFLARFCSIVTITVGLAFLNYTGLEIVGNASLVICIIAMSPFVIMTIIGAPKVVPSRWLQMPETVEEGSDELFDDDFQTGPGPLPLFSLGGILWRPYLNNMFWNLNSFDAAASFASETTSVSTTFPRGVFIGLAMCVLGYIVPMLVAIGATDYSQADWVDGFLGTVAVDIGGEWLGVWTVFAAGISNLALFEAEMSSDAFQLMGMGKCIVLPVFRVP